jgi:hypothetical protein
MTSITYLPFFQNMSMLLRHRFEFTLKETGMIIAVSSFVATMLGIVISFLICDKYE